MRPILFMALVCALIFTSCSKLEKQDQLVTIFKKSDLAELRSQPFNPIKMDYTTRIVKVGYDHGSLFTLRQDSKFTHLSHQLDVDLSNITRSSYAYTSAQIISLPIKNSRDVLIIYSLSDKFTFALAKDVELAGGYRRISITDAFNPGSVYYEVQISKRNTLGKFKFYQRLPLNGTTASEPRATIKPKDGEVQGAENPDDPPENGPGGCCSKAFGDCMNCLVASCSNDWACYVICGFSPPACIASWMIACATGTGCNY